MIRGTTPTHYFTVPCKAQNISKVNVLYGQDDKLLFKKKTSDCTIEDELVTVKLSRNESLMFNHKLPAQVQIVIKQTNDDILESIVQTFGVDKLLDDGVIE